MRSLFRGSSETAVNGFVNAIAKAKGDQVKSCRMLFDRIPNNRLFKIRKEDVRNAPGLYSPLMQAYLAFLYANDAKSWPSGRLLRHVLHENLQADPLAVHHIFPKQHMQEFDIPVDLLNTAANYAVLSQADNAELGDRDPFDVWRSLKANQRECASQQLFFVGREDLLRKEAFDEFLDFRAQKMAENLSSHLGLGAS
ncbi:hypothetical protein [Bradyrhizobium cenepequi]|uniref:hypothetical protein n=1 Tax=Bradyrhizobium cenepequi TaxID=2821403 RepID=UPI001CE2B482|nr:hypothetical protein [Bradyrhizobium cenepequi]MCA6111278.1 hypothetical protein [Bradyrhizobium cenepequi]